MAKHKYALLGFMAVVLGATAAYLNYAPRQYVSTAAIFVGVDGSATPDTRLSDNPAQKPLNQDIADMIVNTDIDLFKSRDLIREALLKEGIDKVYPSIAREEATDGATAVERAVDRLLNRDMSIQAGRSSSVLSITLRNRNQKIARDMLSTLIGAYLKRAALLNNPSLSFLGQQVDATRASLDKARAAYLELLQKQGVTASPDEERIQLLKQRNDIEEQIGDARARMVSDASTQAALTRSLKQTRQQIALSNENDSTMLQVTDAQSRLTAAEERYQIASQSYAPGNPLLKGAENELAAARNGYQSSIKIPSERVRTGPNPVFQEIEKQLALAEADFAAHKSAVDSWTQELQVLQEKLDHLDAVAGDVDNLD